MLSEIVKPGTLENVIIKAQHNCFSDNIQYSGCLLYTSDAADEL